MSTDADQALWVTLVVTAGYQLLFFIIASANRFDKVTDLAGGSNFVLLALLTLGMYAIPDPSPRQIVNTSLVIIWGCRLSVFLFYRILVFQSDNRFDSFRDKPLNFFGFWILQMVWVWSVSLPLIYLNAHETGHHHSLKPADYAGFAMAGAGFIIEAWADQVKLAVKIQSPRIDNHHHQHGWCESGPWYFSRHPNYFGELLFWWGIFISCSKSNTDGDGNFILVGPCFISVLLLLVSGIPILEKSANVKYGGDREYLSYREATSVLIPMPRTIYRNIPKPIKQIFLFEWVMYEAGLGNGGDDQSHAAAV